MNGHRRAARLFDEIGDHYKQGQPLGHLGDTHEAAGDPAGARAAWWQAVAILERLQHPAAEQYAKLAAPARGNLR